MSYPPPSRIPSGPRRRSLLASAAGAALLVGCSDGAGSGDAGPSAAERARARAARDSRELLERYDAVLAAHPGLAERLRPLRARVAAHAAAFEDGTTPTPAPTRSSAAPAPVPAAEKDALAGLAAAERALADRRAEELLEVPGEPARLLASVAAAGGRARLPADGGNQVSEGTEQAAAAELSALQAALAAEHATVYGYGVVGGRIGERRRAEARRPTTPTGRAGTPWCAPCVTWAAARSPRAPGTRCRSRSRTGRRRCRLAARLEERLAGVYADLVRAATGAATGRRGRGRCGRPRCGRCAGADRA